MPVNLIDMFHHYRNSGDIPEHVQLFGNIPMPVLTTYFKVLVECINLGNLGAIESLLKYVASRLQGREEPFSPLKHLVNDIAETIHILQNHPVTGRLSAGKIDELLGN